MISKVSVDHEEAQMSSADLEEANTHIIVHAILAARSGAKSIVVLSHDTDVLMLLLHHRPVIQADEIYFYTGRILKNTDSRKFIPVHILYSLLCEPQRKIILQVYCFTGCDTTSFFYFQGKKAFNLLQQKAEQYKDLETQGRWVTVIKRRASILEICRLNVWQTEVHIFECFESIQGITQCCIKVLTSNK